LNTERLNSDEDGSSVGLIVGIVVIVLVVIAIALAAGYLYKKKRGQDKVQFFGDPNEPKTRSNSEGMPDIATGGDDNSDTKRSGAITEHRLNKSDE